MRESPNGECGMPGCREMLHSRHDVVCREHWDARIAGGSDLTIKCPVCLHVTRPATIRAERGNLIACDECASVIAMHVGRKSYVVVPGGNIERQETTEIRLKVWPSYYFAVESGQMRCQWRREDEFKYRCGDCLLLEEWDPTEKRYTGNQLRVEVTHTLRGPQFGIPEGYVVLSIAVRRRERENVDRDDRGCDSHP